MQRCGDQEKVVRRLILLWLFSIALLLKLAKNLQLTALFIVQL
jgi:hypothetical protein